MDYISSHLIEGERVIFKTRVHWMTFVPWFLLTVGILLTLIFVAENPLAILLIRIAGALALLKALQSYIFYLTSIYGVTSHRVLGKTGLIRIHSLDVLLLKVEAVKLRKTFIGRIFGYGDLVVTGTGGTPHVLHALPQPQRIRKIIQQLANKAHQKHDGVKAIRESDKVVRIARGL